MNRTNEPPDWVRVPRWCAECGDLFYKVVGGQIYCDKHRHLSGSVIRATEQPKFPCPNCGGSVNRSNSGVCWHCGIKIPRKTLCHKCGHGYTQSLGRYGCPNRHGEGIVT